MRLRVPKGRVRRLAGAVHAAAVPRAAVGAGVREHARHHDGAVLRAAPSGLPAHAVRVLGQQAELVPAESVRKTPVYCQMLMKIKMLYLKTLSHPPLIKSGRHNSVLSAVIPCFIWNYIRYLLF